MTSQLMALSAILLCLFFVPLLILVVVFLVGFPCCKGRLIPTWFLCGVFHPFARHFNFQPEKPPRQVPALESPDAESTAPMLSADKPASSSPSSSSPSFIPSFRFRGRRFRLGAGLCPTLSVYLAACLVLSLGFFAFGRIWLLDSEQVRRIFMDKKRCSVVLRQHTATGSNRRQNIDFDFRL